MAGHLEIRTRSLNGGSLNDASDSSRSSALGDSYCRGGVCNAGTRGEAKRTVDFVQWNAAEGMVKK